MLAHLLLLVIDQLPLERLLDGVAQVPFRLDLELGEQFGRHFGERELLDVEHVDHGGNLPPTEPFVRRAVGYLDLQRSRLARLDAGHLLGEVFDLAVGKAEQRGEPHGPLAVFIDDLVAILKCEIRGDEIPGRSRAINGRQASTGGQQPLQFLVDVLGADLAHGALDRQPFPLRHIEFGSHLDIELEGHRSLVGHFDRGHVEIRLADRRQLLVFRNLAQAVHQQRAFHLIGHIFAETVLDQLARSAAGPKARHAGVGHQIAKGLVEIALDVFARHHHRDVSLASAGAGDLDLEL